MIAYTVVNKKNITLCVTLCTALAFLGAQVAEPFAQPTEPFAQPTEPFAQPTEQVETTEQVQPAVNTTSNRNLDQKLDALVLYNAGRYAEAIAICEQEIDNNPRNIESYVVMCWSLVSNRQYSEAEYWALQARSISPFDHRVVEILGEAKYYLGKNQEALALFQEYISLVGENGGRIGEAYYLMGETYIRLEKYNHADISFSKAVRNEPLYDYWWTRLGYAREMANNYALSIVAYEQALVLNAGQGDARLGRNRVRNLL